MATFLELCQSTYQEGSGSGEARPTAVTNQVGDMANIVRWVRESWNDVQRHSARWRWMRGEVTIPVSAGVRDYSIATIFPDEPRRFSRWKPRNGFKFYNSTQGQAGEYRMADVLWEAWEPHDVGVPSQAEARRITVKPDRSLRIIESPATGGTLTAVYYKSPQVLSAGTDVPEMPEEFHSLIYLLAAMKYAVRLSAAEIYQACATRANGVYAELVKDQIEPLETYSQTLVE